MEVYSVGADWYTATNVLTDDGMTASLFRQFYGLTTNHKRWTMGGYKGNECLATGIKYGSRARRDGGADEIMIASGEASAQAIEHVGNVGQYRTTRLDLQLTFKPKTPQPKLAVSLYDKIRAMEGVGASPLGNRKITLIQSGTGSTLYVGSRTSGCKFFRLYDKSLDLGGEPGEYWRAEVQYGKKLARGAIGWYVAHRDQKATIADLICSEFWDAMGWSPRYDYDYVFIENLKEQEDPTTLDNKLAWLKACVRPTLALLIENGLEGEARNALGLRVSNAWMLAEKRARDAKKRL